jgi:hypothetical protein
MSQSTPESTIVHRRGPVEGASRDTTTEEARRPGRRFVRTRPFGRRPVERPQTPPITEGVSRTRVVARDRLYRRLLAGADVIAAALAIVLATSVFGDDRLKYGALVLLPLVILIHKMAGLYDHDGIVLKRSTLDEAPMLFQLAGLFTLVAYLAEAALIDGSLVERQVLGLWITFFACTLGGRLVARHLASRRSTIERCLVIGDPEVGDRVGEKMRNASAKAEVVATLPLAEGSSVAKDQRI